MFAVDDEIFQVGINESVLVRGLGVVSLVFLLSLELNLAKLLN